jgi:parallel beta-helix repeat protein
LINCTISGNTATNNGGGMVNSHSANTTVANCILWGNTANEIAGPGIPTVTFSDVQGGWPGDGNIDVDPAFVDPANDDYHLLPGSPCIDAGDNSAVPPDSQDLDDNGDVLEPVPYDLDGNSRFVDDECTVNTGLGTPPIVDMGAYEFQGCCVCDLNGDGSVGVNDFLLLLSNWGPCANCENCEGDFDGDCVVGITDFLILLANWGPCP